MFSWTSVGNPTEQRSGAERAVACSEGGQETPRAPTGSFEATVPFTLFDYFRVPYGPTRAAPADFPPELAALSVRDGSRFLAWPTRELLGAEGTRPGAYFVGTTPIFGQVAHDAQIRKWAGGSWQGHEEIRDEQGSRVAAIWRRDDGSILLPFDPNELIASFWSERYLQYVRPAAVSRLATLARRGYYRARPFLPRPLQMSMRRTFSRVQSKAQFPRWPVETAVHDLYDLLFELVTAVAQRPVPYIAPWPRAWSWALVLTHDVETQAGYDRLSDLREVELELGYRSSWNFVPRNRYLVESELLETLREQGFEIGVHGLYHDGRDVSSLAGLRSRLPAIRRYAEDWHAVGFRSPGTIRAPELMPMLGFDYDSSYSDTAPFEPQAGGCCTWLPYMLEELVELPITLAQDHTLFDLLGYRDANIWLEKARFLRHRGGMALVLTHSDYVGNGYLVGAYRRLLQEFAGDTTAWKALPRDVSDWWRRRAKSSLQQRDGEWCVLGPAEGDARIEFASPQAPGS